MAEGRKSGGFRLRLGGGRCAPATFRYALLSVLRSTFPARRPQTEASSRAGDGYIILLCHSSAKR